MHRNYSRRSFLGTAAAGFALTGFAPRAWSLQEESAAELVMGKDQRLLVLKKYPPVLETPLKLLLEDRVTPGSLLFVRNNSQPDNAATLQPSREASWSVRLAGDISRQVSISLQQLQEMPSTEYEMVLQCSGNGRSLFSKAAQTSGTQWGRGGMGNVRFSGVRLNAVLDKLGIDVGDGVEFINASGADDPLEGKEDFLHSLPAAEVLNRSILATDMNGEPLPAIHGGPVRLITPGVFGTMQMKWLSELRFVSEESTNYNHATRYRVPKQTIKPGAEYEFSLQNSDYNWYLKTKSVILSPNDGDEVRSGKNAIEGVAFNDGQAAISSVVVSTDKGRTWTQAELSRSDSRYGWTRFVANVSLKAGWQSIWCRAVDELGRSQPADGSIAWNQRGYEWNGIEKIDVTVG